MKAKKWLEILTMMALCGMVAPLVGTVHAREGWYAYRVDRVNDGLCGGHVRLTRLDGDSRFALKWFRLPEDQKANIIATAIAAMHSGQTVYANMDIDSGIFPQIRAMHLNPKDRTTPVQRTNGLLKGCEMVRTKVGTLLGTVAVAAVDPS